MANSLHLETLRTALTSLRANRLRSLLTMLGIGIGVATVISISSIITGLNNKVAAFADQFGSNLIYVYHLPIGQRPTPQMLARRRLTVEEAEAMAKLPHVVAVNPGMRYQFANYGIGEVAVKYGGKAVQNTLLEGDTESIPQVGSLNLKEGSYFTAGDMKRRANVAVLGYDTAQKLFGDSSAIGKDIDVGGDIFTVIGVVNRTKQVFGSGPNPEDNIVYMPLTAFHKIHPEVKDVWISLRYDNAANRSLVEYEIRNQLRGERKVPVTADDDFEIFTPDTIVKLWTSITGGLVIFMVAVSSVGLMVGGVGVMNIMLVSVTERTREIGVRKAIGATRQSILLQFTIEAVTLCAIGGVLGILVGGAITLLVHGLNIGLPASMSTTWTSIAFFASCSIGLVFGIYPAWKAAMLNPIDALRYE